MSNSPQSILENSKRYLRRYTRYDNGIATGTNVPLTRRLMLWCIHKGIEKVTDVIHLWATSQCKSVRKACVALLLTHGYHALTTVYLHTRVPTNFVQHIIAAGLTRDGADTTRDTATLTALFKLYTLAKRNRWSLRKMQRTVKALRATGVDVY